MKDVPIKFRAKTKEGVTVYSVPNYDDLFGDLCEIDDSTFVQLVGYDVNGAEVYEGNRIKDLATGDVIHAKICACDAYEIGITTAYFEKVGNDND